MFKFLALLYHRPDLIEVPAQEGVFDLDIITVQYRIQPFLVSDPIVFQLLLDRPYIFL
jgi:hypothetical protein